MEPEHELEAQDEQVVVRYRGLLSDLSLMIRSLLSYWNLYLNELENDSMRYSFQAQATGIPGLRGCPSFDVEQSQIQYLRSLNFTWSEISNLLGVSRMTVYRRRNEFGMLAPLEV